MDDRLAGGTDVAWSGISGDKEASRLCGSGELFRVGSGGKFCGKGESDAVKDRRVDKLNSGGFCFGCEDGSEFAAKSIAGGTKFFFAPRAEAIEQIETDLRVEDGRANWLKREKLASLVLELFNSLLAAFGDGLQDHEREVFRIESGQG